MSGTGGSSGRISIQPSQASVLVQALKKEMDLAKAAGADKEKAKAHYAKAEKINQILIDYQAQQKADQKGTPSTGGTSSAQGSSHGSASASAVNSPRVRSQSPPAEGSLSGSGSGKNSVITVQKLNQINASLDQLAKSIKDLEDSKAGETDTTKVQNIDKEIAKLKPKLVQYQKLSQYIRNDLANQGRNSASSSPTPTPSQENAPQSLKDDKQYVQKPPVTHSTGAAANANLGARPANPTLNRPRPAPSGISGVSSQMPSGLSGLPSGLPTGLPTLTRTTAPTGPIQGMRAPSLATKSMLGNRPLLGNGLGSGLGYSMSSPSITRMPYEYSSHITPTGIPDNGGRVLTKRRLAELANTIGATEGDMKTVVDGDVEDLLLDLADEFVASVTGFACKIAKHRKADKVDIRDFQLNLERNWNIRIPGLTMDEIKPPRKLQPSSEYQEKKNELDPKPANK